MKMHMRPEIKPSGPHAEGRRGFTLLEVTAALAMLLMAATLAAQLVFWNLHEAARSRAKQEAQEIAANVLESARSLPWSELGSSWAIAQHLSPALEEQGWRLTVAVALEQRISMVKRVTVTLQPPAKSDDPAPPVQLVGLYSARTAPAQGGMP